MISVWLKLQLFLSFPFFFLNPFNLFFATGCTIPSLGGPPLPLKVQKKIISKKNTHTHKLALFHSCIWKSFWHHPTVRLCRRFWRQKWMFQFMCMQKSSRNTHTHSLSLSHKSGNWFISNMSIKKCTQSKKIIFQLLSEHWKEGRETSDSRGQFLALPW
jgi:hypothetical protein